MRPHRLIVTAIGFAFFLSKSNVADVTNIRDQVNFYGNLLKDIHQERGYDTLVIVHEDVNVDLRLKEIYGFPHPKIFLSKHFEFFYKQDFNSEILVIIIMSGALDLELMGIAARSLNYIRQSRILIIARNVSNEEEFMVECLALLEEYPMTNVLLHFLKNSFEIPLDYQQLKPFPEFHWQKRNFNEKDLKYYPQHWRNLYGTNITTHTDQSLPSSVTYIDERGNLKLNGHVARLVLLFAEYFNGTLRMYRPLEINGFTHFTVVADMATKRLIDIAMCLHVISTPGHSTWTYASDVYEIGRGMIIVPCSQPLSIGDMFEILLNEYFFGMVIICTLLFSILHFVIEYYFDGEFSYTDLILNNRIIGGVLGLSFSGRNSPWRGLKLIYILLFFAGLNINAQFSARDLAIMGGIMLDIFRSLIITEDVAEYSRMRFNFNTTTGYYATLAQWKLFSLKQKYHSHKTYCTYENLTLHKFIPWNILLQPNSQYKDAFNYLIHRVHEAGLSDAWYASAFNDLLKLKRLSLADPNPEGGPSTMTVDDLRWAWL
uniref:Ionotropic glutamate receptor L-glutamate and glycine-binding domain-containing protein n=1 Tax=Musca domestica TaxID=7370 RepID=A0A1I8MTF3_MUSDO